VAKGVARRFVAHTRTWLKEREKDTHCLMYLVAKAEGYKFPTSCQHMAILLSDLDLNYNKENTESEVGPGRL
jgi:hypothetical protein